MSRMVDDEPPIKSHPASKEYRDNWDRVFGEPEAPKPDSDGIEIRVRYHGHHCNVCARDLEPGEDPEDHRYHAVVTLDEPRVEAAGNVSITEPAFVEACREAKRPWEAEEKKFCGACGRELGPDGLCPDL